MKISWSPEAEQSFIEAADYIAKENPGAAASAGAKILEAVEALARFPRMGHASDLGVGTREFAVPGTPFVVFYSLGTDVVRVVAVLHGKRQRPYTI
jgi:plasmid stabilization system protein ParE